jgi:hypothetical protein
MNVFFNSVDLPDFIENDIQILIDQFLAFEKGSQAHDDGPDATHGAFSVVNVATHISKNKYAFGSKTSHKF